MKARRAGLENIVGAVLLITVVTACAFILYYWLSVYVQVASKSIYEQAVIEHIEIVSLNITETATGEYNVTAFVLNAGKFPVEILAISVDNAVSGTLADQCIRNVYVVIEPGETKPVSLICSLTKGTYEVSVMSSRGFEASKFFTLS